MEEGWVKLYDDDGSESPKSSACTLVVLSVLEISASRSLIHLLHVVLNPLTHFLSETLAKSGAPYLPPSNVVPQSNPSHTNRFRLHHPEEGRGLSSFKSGGIDDKVGTSRVYVVMLQILLFPPPEISSRVGQE
ncbi:hypothetical protein C2845_PM07G38590 [Panicum miliaceum]|uniref:Uncharacterized protein n=1 Tax=Panicum miliaceum TaxID=4540 RepID=A0A3L6SLA4_PANMI|nr:hypothetical protein C2845_PM07G38590 [Panicum miliaceum]